MSGSVRSHGIEGDAFTIPTSGPEADGTCAWSQTTTVTVHIATGQVTGYADVSVAALIEHTLAQHIFGADSMSPCAIYDAMVRAVWNLGRPGVASMAISTVDIAVHDAKARVLGIP